MPTGKISPSRRANKQCIPKPAARWRWYDLTEGSRLNLLQKHCDATTLCLFASSGNLRARLQRIPIYSGSRARQECTQSPWWLPLPPFASFPIRKVLTKRDTRFSSLKISTAEVNEPSKRPNADSTSTCRRRQPCLPVKFATGRTHKALSQNDQVGLFKW